MYESEVNGRVESPDAIPADVLARFAEFREHVSERTVISWGEHCTECVWPTCYSSCELYSPREDGKCQRFVDGTVRVDFDAGVNPYLLKVRFKRWAKFLAPANVHLFPVAEARQLEQDDVRASRWRRRVPRFRRARIRASQRTYVSKRDWAESLAGPSARLPSYFALEIYNPQAQPVSMTLTARPKDTNRKITFQRLLALVPGYNRIRIPTGDFASRIDVAANFGIDLTLNDAEEGTALIFGLMDFVLDPIWEREQSVAAKPARKVKCVVWDLDNTLWHGVLVEDGAEQLRLREGVAELIRALDERGILLSVASKNDHAAAMAVLERFGLVEYFLYPQISWGPKGQAVNAIAKSLNIGRDTLMFIDDSPFERAEVGSVCPDVQIFDVDVIDELLARPEFDVPVTDDSRARRQMYQQDARRKGAQTEFDGDYFQFLRDSGIELRLSPLDEASLDRVNELTTRTNQMNFSGNRYDHERLREILANDTLETWVMSCRDHYGSYGTVGFSVVEKSSGTTPARMIDLMFSCRIQSKRIEHAYLTFLLERHLRNGLDGMLVNYRKTDRNAASGRVFDDFGFDILREREGVTELRFPAARDILDDGIVTLVVEE